MRAKLPARFGAPQSDVVNDPESSVSGVTRWTAHASMTREVVTVSGLPATPPAVITTCPVWVPTPRFTGLSDRVVVSDGGAVPVVGASPIHAVSLVADQFSVPPPVLETMMEDVCAAVL